VSELPKGWVETNFANISDYIQRGKSPKYTECSDYPVVNQKSVRWFGIEEQHLKYVHPEQWEKWDEQRYIKVGDILWNSTGTGTIGRACFVDIQQIKKAKVVDSHVTIVRTNTNIESRFAFYWIMHPEIQGAISGIYNGSTNQVELSKKVVETTKFLLPPLGEQKRIVEKLDQVLAQVDTIKARLDSIPAILKRFRQSVLAAAVSGKLTEEWRGSCDVQFPWRVKDLINVSRNIVDCPHSTPKWTDENTGNYCIRTTGFNPFYLDFSKQGFVSNEVYEERIKRLEPQEGDILYSREGTVGIACQIPKGVKLCLGQRMILIRANKEVGSRYLTLVLNSEHILRIVKSLTIGSTAPRVNMKDIKTYPIPVPSLAEQTEIVRLVDQYFAFADTIEQQVQKAQQRVDKLTQSILAKAFRGELVPQNPDDEPADQLLKRIAAARAESEALAKAAKKVGKRK
jgi:type I restriction enzyme, S subunit